MPPVNACQTLYGCKADIITEDTDYSAYLKSDENVSALHLREYMTTKQELINMTRLVEINEYFANNYNDIGLLDNSEVNAYLPDGSTLIISAVRNRNATLEERKEKISCLVERVISARQFSFITSQIIMKIGW